MNEQDEKNKLYVLFLLHAVGRRIVPYTCPNCGDMPHLRWKEDGRFIHKCMQCKCVSSTTENNNEQSNR